MTRPMMAACPFCGRTNIQLRSVPIGSAVGCEADDCSAGVWGETAYAAVGAWNHRVTPYTGEMHELGYENMLEFWETRCEIPEEWMDAVEGEREP